MRKAAEMSQEQLAELLCTKKATISAYENDRIDIRAVSYWRLQKHWDVQDHICWREMV